MTEVRVRVCEVEGKQVAFVDLIDRENKRFKTLNNRGEWQDCALYLPAPPEMMLDVRVDGVQA